LLWLLIYISIIVKKISKCIIFYINNRKNKEERFLMGKTSVTINDVLKAESRIYKYICHTPLLREKQMDKVLGCQVYLKPEMFQITGSFKIRGALNKILSLT
jgi:predicted alternative tryptophan synthase beta-subunit